MAGITESPTTPAPIGKKPKPVTGAVTKKHMEWMAWRVDDFEVRVQIHRPDIAKAFSKVKGARLAAYSVVGRFMKIFHVKQSVPWVDAWMKEFMRRAVSGTPDQKER